MQSAQRRKPWIASALLPVCVECSDEIKIWSSVVAVSTIDASWQSVNDDADDARNDVAWRIWVLQNMCKQQEAWWVQDAKWSREHRWVAESHKSKDAMNKMSRSKVQWCPLLRLEEYFHLAFIKTRQQDVCLRARVRLKRFQLVLLGVWNNKHSKKEKKN